MDAPETAAAIISKPLHRLLTDLTGEARLDVAVHQAAKELARVRLRECEAEIGAFEKRYGTDLDSFKAKWESGHIEGKHSHQVEQDYWEWEAAVTNRAHLLATLDRLP